MDLQLMDNVAGNLIHSGGLRKGMKGIQGLRENQWFRFLSLYGQKADQMQKYICK